MDPPDPMANLARSRLYRACSSLSEGAAWSRRTWVVRRATGGSETVPTVGFGGDYLVNPRPAQVLNLIATHNPEWARTLVEKQPPKRRRFRRN